MNDKIERQSIRKRSLNHKAEVKPQGCEASADLLIVRQSPEKPMFNDQLGVPSINNINVGSPVATL